MNTDPVRLNITLPKKLVQSLDKLAGPRKRSRFIAEALENQIKQYEKTKLEKLLAELRIQQPNLDKAWLDQPHLEADSLHTL